MMGILNSFIYKASDISSVTKYISILKRALATYYIAAEAQDSYALRKSFGRKAIQYFKVEHGLQYVATEKFRKDSFEILANDGGVVRAKRVTEFNTIRIASLTTELSKPIREIWYLNLSTLIIERVEPC